MQKKIIIIRCGALGDLVYATSVIDALREQFGSETLIDFVCTPGSGNLFLADTRVHHVFPLKHNKIPLFFSKQKKAIVKHSQQNPYDILINFEFGKQFASLLKNIQAKQKVGAQLEQLSLPQNCNRALMQKEFYKSLVKDAIMQKSYPSVATQDFESVQTKYALKDKYIILAPSNSHVNRSGINYRAWDNEKWRELTAKLSQEVQVVLVGAKGEENFFQELKPYPKNVVDLVGKNSILELSTVIKYAQAVVCTDSAVGHISAAVNTPVFVLMGPNNPLTDSPYKTPYNSVTVISLNIECSPCYKTQVMKECTENLCMKNISVAMVYEHIVSSSQKLLSKG